MNQKIKVIPEHRERRAVAAIHLRSMGFEFSLIPDDSQRNLVVSKPPPLRIKAYYAEVALAGQAGREMVAERYSYTLSSHFSSNEMRRSLGEGVRSSRSNFKAFLAAPKFELSSTFNRYSNIKHLIVNFSLFMNNSG